MLKKDIPLFFSFIAPVSEDKAYSCAMGFNALFEINLQNGECAYIKKFQQEDSDASFLYCRAYTIGDCIVFAPCTARNIAIYNYVTKTSEVIALADEHLQSEPGTVLFADAVLHKNCIYMIGASKPIILKYNVITKEQKVISYIPNKSFLFRKGVLLDGDTIIAVSLNTNLVLEYNITSGKIETYELTFEFKGAYSCCRKSGAYWMAPRAKGSGFVRWKKKQDKSIVLPKIPKDINYYSGALFSKILSYGDYLYAIPEYAPCGLRVNADTMEIEVVPELSLGEGYRGVYLFENSNKVYFIKCRRDSLEYDINDKVMIFNLETQKIEMLNFYISDGYEAFIKESIEMEKTGDTFVLNEKRNIVDIRLLSKYLTFFNS